MLLRRLSALFMLLFSMSAAGAVDPSLFQELHWRLIGPFRGGRVLAVSGVPDEPQHFYFGSVNGGVWETNDAGRTWQPIFDGQPIGSIGALAVAPSNTKVLYVGTGEADMRSDISQGAGMFKSADGGRSWKAIGLSDSQQIGRIVIHPTNADIVYVAALGHPYGPNAERGVFRSRDGGSSWQKILGNDNDTGAIDLALEPGNPNVLYAALWQTRRTPWSIYPPSNGPGSGLFKSIDGGDHWTAVLGHGFPAKPGRIGIAVAPSRPQRVYALVDAEAGGMYRSDDGGANWIRSSDDSRIWARGWYFGGVAVEPANADVVYSMNVNVFRSEDGGKTFLPIKGAPGGDDYHELWIDRQHPERRILGVDQGAIVSVNGGKSWSSWFNQPTGQFYHVNTDNRFPYMVYGSQQDSGAAGVPSRTSTIDGISMPEFREVTAGGESDNVVPDPSDPEIIYGGRVDRLDTRSRQTHSIDPTLAYPGNDRRTWTLPLAFSARDPHVLYFSNQRVFRTEDGGEHWTVISPDLTREDPGTPPNLDPVTAALNTGSGPRRGVVYALAPSRRADRDLWVGTDDGQIWRTRDDGGHWDNITPAALTGWSKVGIIDTSHFDSETAYAAVDRHRLDDFKPYIYRTHDGGKSWQLIASGIPEGSFVNAVREDSERKGLLFAGTERGVYVSFNDGDQWQPLQSGLPVTSVRDLVVHGNDLVIATHGRAFWILDDVTPLRQVTDARTAGAAAWLYRPALAIRERPAGFTGTPMPKDEPMAANPPFGAVIDYVLNKEAKSPVTLEIFDASDTPVRRYSSADIPPPVPAAKLRTAADWVVKPSVLQSSAGMHRFIWPIRYLLPPALAAGRGAYADGIWAPPGSYKVVLTVDGQRWTQPLTVVPDPRVRLTPAAYSEQFTMAREIEQLRAAVAPALDEAETLATVLASRRSTAGALSGEFEALQRKAAEISDVTAETSTAWWLTPKKTTTLRFVDGVLDALANAVDGTDVAPSPDARRGLAQIKPVAEEALRQWGELKKNELAKLAEELKSTGQPPLTP